MSNEFVLVLRETAKQAAHLLAAHSTGPSLERDTAEELRDALEKPVEQHQGEPVALPARKRVDPFCYDQGGNARADGWNDCLDEIAKLGPLYHHADPGEVERLTEQLEVANQAITYAAQQGKEKQKTIDALMADAKQFRVERDTLRAQLAERDALLRRAYDADQAARHLQPYNVSKLMDEIEAALSSSAEPSAPIHTSDHRLMTSARELPDAERAKVQLMVSLLPSEESARILSKCAGRILTSDETVEKFYRQIVEASEVKPSAPEWDGKSWDVVLQRDDKTVLSIRSNGVMDAYDREGLKAFVKYLTNLERGASVDRDERAEFEAAVLENEPNSDLDRNADGEYMNFYLECAWKGWQARSTKKLKS